jgi:hypothetical protein
MSTPVSTVADGISCRAQAAVETSNDSNMRKEAIVTMLIVSESGRNTGTFWCAFMSE